MIDWSSKLQNNAETTTYGSKSTAMRTPVDYIIGLRRTFDHRSKFRSLIKPLFFANKSIVLILVCASEVNCVAIALLRLAFAILSTLCSDAKVNSCL